MGQEHQLSRRRFIKATLALTSSLGLATSSLSSSPVLPPLMLSSPVPVQFFQANALDQADIAVRGNIAIGTFSVEARWRGGAWTTIATNATGDFSGKLAHQPIGQGTLEVRLVEDIAISVSAQYVSVGDIFLGTGQSNMVGLGTVINHYESDMFVAGMLGNDYRYKELVDPWDAHGGQKDRVARDTYHGGSVIPFLATHLMAATGRPVCFIPCARVGSSITQWQEGDDPLNRRTLFGSMNSRGHYVGGVRGVIHWQGERDARLGMERSDYRNYLEAFATSVHKHLGVSVMPFLLQRCKGIPPVQEAAIRHAQMDAMANRPQFVQGPDLSDIVTDDGLHIRAPEKQNIVAQRTATAMLAAFYL